MIRGRAEIVEEKGRHKIVITEIPYQVYKSRIVEAIAEAHAEKRITGIARLDDESNRKGMKVVVELQKSATPKVVLNQLFKHTPLQAELRLQHARARAGRRAPRADGSVALEPQVLSLKQLLEHFIAHRKDVIVRRTRYDLRKAEERAHLLEGYRIALDNIDEVIEIVRGSQTTDEAKPRLSERFGLSEIQAQAIVDMRLRTLVGLERKKIEDEYTELIKTIAELQDILASDRRVAAIVKDETLDLKKRFGDERRTDVQPAEDEISMEAAHSERWTWSSPTRWAATSSASRSTRSDAKPRRARRHRHRQPQTRRRRAQLLHHQDARPRTLLHEQGPRLSHARLRDSRHDAYRQRHGVGQFAHAAARAKTSRRSSRSTSSRARSTSSW